MEISSLLPFTALSFLFFVILLPCQSLDANPDRDGESEVEPRTTTPSIQSCLSQSTCPDCIQIPGCGWCSEGDFHGSDKQPLPRCNTIEGHQNLGRFKCRNEFLYSPENRVDIIRNDPISKAKRGPGGKTTPIKPQQIDIKVRKGVPIEIEIVYEDPKDYPLDLYYLMDLTKTMEDDKIYLARLGNELGTRLWNLTKSYRQGFGSFIDKVAMPYVRMTPELLENPCLLSKDNCARPYGYKNHLSLSAEFEKFSEEVQKAQLSGSADSPEGGLDALMQAMVCGERIGWSEDSRRVVIVATDAPFHIAGDGKLGGILPRNDEKCHLDEDGEYTHSTEMDYPSLAQLNRQSIANSVIVIFAVTQEHLEIYRKMANRIEGAKAALLSEDSSNVVNLVVEEYQKISSTIKISDTFPRQYVKVTYFSKCLGSDDADESQSDVCHQIPVGSAVRFKVKVELLQCPERKEEWKQENKIYRVGLSEGVLVNLEMLCDCPCENEENWIIDSDKCSGHGTEKCGLCECYDSYFGQLCQCSAKGGSAPVDEIKACTAPNATQVCSGRGQCSCGVCECDIRVNPNEKYTGTFCECDNFSCERHNGEMCSGQGICVCGKCICNSGWEGRDCSCSADKTACKPPVSVDAELCNARGSCVCGNCQCDGKFTGQFCQKCLHEDCPNKCEELSPCVQCRVFGSGPYGTSEECDAKCDVQIEIVEVISRETSSSEDEILCAMKDETDECTFYFVYGENYIDAQSMKECPPPAPIFWILLAIASTVVLGGIFLIIVWKVYTTIKDKKEFSEFTRQKEEEPKITEMENPLFRNPNTLTLNPMHTPKE